MFPRDLLRRRARRDLANPHRSIFGVTYCPSKTALNVITSFAIELTSTRIKVNAACPGFTATDLNNFEGTRTVQQAARKPVRLAPGAHTTSARRAVTH
jgi:NAD(P)-dependent dehydrogenase (short-subunit alcohol dehydrogenase family)